MLNFNICGAHWKIQLLGKRVHRKLIKRGGEFAWKGGTLAVCQFKEGRLGKNEWVGIVLLRGVDTRQFTFFFTKFAPKIISGQKLPNFSLNWQFWLFGPNLPKKSSLVVKTGKKWTTYEF